MTIRLKAVAAFCALVLAGFFVLWLLTPLDIQEPVPGTLRAVGPVEVTAPGELPEAAENLATLDPGARLDIPEGSTALLYLQDGVIARLDGPAAATLAESRRTVAAPSVFLGLVSRALLGKDVSGTVDTVPYTGLALHSGTVAVKAGSAAAGPVVLSAPGFHARVEQSIVQASLAPGGMFRWDTLQGAPALGMFTLREGQWVPVVLHQAPARVSLGATIWQPVPGDSGGVPNGVTSLTDMVSRLKKGESPLSASGIDYVPLVEPPGIQMLVGAALGQAPAPVGTVSHELPSIEDIVGAPGVETRVLTDHDLLDSLPPGMSVHLLPGNRADLRIGALTYPVRIGVNRGHLELKGMPLGINPLGYVPELPALLSLETTDGAVTVTYLPNEAPAPPAGGAPEPLPHTAPYFSTIPTPVEMFGDWESTAANLILAAWLLLVMQAAVEAANNVLGANEGFLARYAGPLDRLRRIVPFRARTDRLRLIALLTGNALLLILVNGILFCFLDAGFRPWEGAGLEIVPTMLLGGAAVSIADLLVRGWVLARWGVPHSYAFNRGNLLVAALTVGLSRALQLTPGLMVGCTGDLRLHDEDALSEPRQRRLLWLGVAGTAVVGMAAWFGTLAVSLMAGSPLTAGVARVLQGPFSLLQDILLVTFAGAVAKVFFSLLPIPSGPGLSISRNRVLWASSVLGAGFIFFQMTLQDSGVLTSLFTGKGSLLGVLVVLSLGGAFTVSYISHRQAGKEA